MKTTINSKVIYRIPRFPLNVDLKEIWNELKEAISQSSGDFYALIADTSSDQLDQLPFSIRQTVAKYYNRAKFRATPYGTFAAIGLTTMEWNKNAALILKNGMNIHKFPDWSHASDLANKTEGVNSPDVLYFANTTYYTVQDEIRFIQIIGEEFQIAAIDLDPEILSILDHCQQPKHLKDLLESIQNKMGEDVLRDYLKELVSLQLIFTSNHPNIIGKEYFSRIQSVPIDADKQYLITEREPLSGSLDASAFRHLGKVVTLLHNLVPVTRQPDLDLFITQYIRKFEQLEIPLMVALDPEVGIGYGKLEKYQKTFTLLDHLYANSGKSKNTTTTNLRNALYPEIVKALTSGTAVNIGDLVIEEPAEHLPIPNSLSALTFLVNDELYLESLGGTTAISLLGRFALAVTEVLECCKDIAVGEQEANPEVLFFDVGYIKEGGIDNINRRPAIYDLQLSILNYDTSDSPLSLTDLLVCVRGSEVCLRSRKYNKRMVPRLTTAYNFNRSDLSLFRFLMDLQQQGLQTQLLFKPFDLIPGLVYYPRIQFANIVIARAAWTLTTKIYGQAKDENTRKIKLKEYLKTNVLSDYIRSGNGDQTLCLNTSSDQDIQLLMGMLSKKGKIIIEEFPLPTSATVTDLTGAKYLPEILLTLQHQESIYRPLPDLNHSSPDLDKKLSIPLGGDWLYFEIFTSPVHTDFMLSKVKAYLAKFRNHIKLWFFVRYNQEGDHLRLRIQLKQQEQAYVMIKELSQRLQKEISSGIVSDLRLCTYKKEVQRYSTVQMEALEYHFCMDSKYVLNMIRSLLPDLQKYKHCVEIMQTLAESSLMASGHYQKLIRVSYDAFCKEQNVTPTAFKELNKIYREYLSQATPSLSKSTFKSYTAFKQSFLTAIDNCTYKVRAKRAADLMHMHVNRLFAADQRTHELIIYHILNNLEKQNSKKHKNS